MKAVDPAIFADPPSFEQYRRMAEQGLVPSEADLAREEEAGYAREEAHDYRDLAGIDIEPPTPADEGADVKMERFAELYGAAWTERDRNRQRLVDTGGSDDDVVDDDDDEATTVVRDDDAEFRVGEDLDSIADVDSRPHLRPRKQVVNYAEGTGEDNDAEGGDAEGDDAEDDAAEEDAAMTESGIEATAPTADGDAAMTDADIETNAEEDEWEDCSD